MVTIVKGEIMAKEAITIRLDEETIKRLDGIVEDYNQHDKGLGIEYSRADIIRDMINRECGDDRIRIIDLINLENRMMNSFFSLKRQVNVLLHFYADNQIVDVLVDNYMKNEKVSKEEAVEKICTTLSGSGLPDCFWTAAAWGYDLHSFFKDKTDEKQK